MRAQVTGRFGNLTWEDGNLSGSPIPVQTARNLVVSKADVSIPGVTAGAATLDTNDPWQVLATMIHAVGGEPVNRIDHDIPELMAEGTAQ